MEIQYGKTRVVFFRLAKRSAPPFGASVTIDVFGERFAAAYTAGDNREVVATDTMKNFVYATAADFDGRSLEAYVMFLGKRLLDTYPQMERIRVTAHEVPLDAAHGREHGGSDVVFRLTRTDIAMSHADFERRGDSVAADHVRCGIEGLRLLKTTGSSFAQFARDKYTSLPELADRPLTIRMDVHWRYADASAATDAKGHVPPDDVRRSLEHTFHEFNSKSIQELVHVMAAALLKEFPSLSEVEFSAENHTPDKVADGPGDVRVFAEPRQTFGKIGLVLRR
ncbi:MAG TPA: urate oxidase [Candidatus Limnocylindria bacterium]|nr:urate oxidase [Candidatus Limnocylindria bacterium]